MYPHTDVRHNLVNNINIINTTKNRLNLPYWVERCPLSREIPSLGEEVVVVVVVTVAISLEFLLQFQSNQIQINEWNDTTRSLTINNNNKLTLN